MITIVKTLDSVIFFQRVLIFLFLQTINLDGLSSKFVLLYSSDFSVLGVLSEGYSMHKFRDWQGIHAEFIYSI